MRRALAVGLLAAAILGGCGGEPDEESLSYRAGRATADDWVQINRALTGAAYTRGELDYTCRKLAISAEADGRTWETGDIEAEDVDNELFVKGCMAGMEDGLGYLRD